MDTFEYKTPAHLPQEDIDSDDAFDSADDERFGNFFRRQPAIAGKHKQKERQRQAAANEPSSSEDEEDKIDMREQVDDDDENDGFMTISEMLATRAEEEAEEGKTVAGSAAPAMNNDDFSADEEDGNEDRRLQQLALQIEELDKRTKRKAQRVEAHPESEFNLVSHQSVDLNDMLGALKESTSFGTLKRQVERVEKSGLRLDKPQVRADAERAMRAVAYDKAAVEVTKWQPTVKAQREADHVSFPLNAVKSAETSASLADKFTPTTLLERQVAEILKSSTAAAESTKSMFTPAEELALQAMTPDEARERRKELAKMRALQSYFTAKARRMKKIKSKRYRKIQKKARLKQQDKEHELLMSNPELAEAERLKAERLRAEERLTLKHKNKSQWVKTMLSRRDVDPESRQAVAEQVRPFSSFLTCFRCFSGCWQPF